MSELMQLNTALKQLEFELDQGSGPRFLLAVCDSTDRADNIREILDSHLRELGISAIHITVPNSRGNLVDAILYQAGSQKLSAVHIVQFENIDANSTEALFGELNFQRDSLARLNIPIIVWLHSNQIQQLTARAPDFWSRRTAIFYFDDLSVGTLLKRIFDKAETTDQVAPDEISRALKEVLDSERELQGCLLDKQRFSLSRTDNIIQRLRSSVQALLRECAKGRKINVALWLWNASQMNSRIRYPNLIKGAAPAYPDRSELLLSMAQRIENVLDLYLRQLEHRIRNRSTITLIGTFVSYATRIWRKIVQGAKRDAMRTLSIEPYDFLDEKSTRRSWLEDVYRNRATEQFESWLAGDTEKKPLIFSDEEVALLKYLYHRKQGRTASPPISPSRIKKLIPELQTKVRLWLGDIGPFS